MPLALVVFNYPAALHDKFHFLKLGDIGERITGHGDDVGVFSVVDRLANASKKSVLGRTVLFALVDERGTR